MNIEYAQQALNRAEIISRSKDARFANLGNALVDYWRTVLCQLGAIVWTEPSKIDILEPGWDRDEPPSPWLHSRN